MTDYMVKDMAIAEANRRATNDGRLRYVCQRENRGYQCFRILTEKQYKIARVIPWHNGGCACLGDGIMQDHLYELAHLHEDRPYCEHCGASEVDHAL